MEYYTGCRITVVLPEKNSLLETRIEKLLIQKLPGVSVVFTIREDAPEPYPEASVPNGHALAYAQQQESPGGEMKPTGANLLLSTAWDIIREEGRRRQSEA